MYTIFNKKGLRVRHNGRALLPDEARHENVVKATRHQPRGQRRVDEVAAGFGLLRTNVPEGRQAEVHEAELLQLRESLREGLRQPGVSDVICFIL